MITIQEAYRESKEKNIEISNHEMDSLILNQKIRRYEQIESVISSPKFIKAVDEIVETIKKQKLNFLPTFSMGGSKQMLFVDSNGVVVQKNRPGLARAIDSAFSDFSEDERHLIFISTYNEILGDLIMGWYVQSVSV